MEVNLEKETICVNRQVTTKKEMIYVQGDIIVPDSKPDILSTINTCGNVSIYKKEVLDGKIRIDGNINTYIMYLADNESDNVRGINSSFDFSETLMVPECKQDMTVWLDASVKTIDAKVLNGRKLSLKIGVEVQIKVFSREDVEIVNKINDDNIQVLEKNISLNSQVGEGNNTAFVKDTISIDNGDTLAEILKADIKLVDKDIKLSYNKVLAKAEAQIKVMYLTEDGQIKSITSRIPLVGFVDIANVQEENICDIVYEIKNIIIKPNPTDENSIYVEMEVQISCVAYEEKPINLISDLYSISDKLVLSEDKINGISNKNQRKDICEIREKLKVPELDSNNLIDIDITPNITNRNKSNTKVIYEGELILKLIYENDSTVGVNTKILNVPFEFTLDNVEDAESMEVNSEIEITREDFEVQDGGNLDCSIDMTFNTDMYRNQEVNVIQKVDSEIEDGLEDYSVIIYVIKKGDTLWQIAKKFKSTVDDIVRANAIENPDKINIGEKIYIPKYVKSYVSA